jgi:hypothetical protein
VTDVNGFARTMSGADTDRLAQAQADRAEADTISRLQRLIRLRDTIDDAVRHAEAHQRLENALRYGRG